MASPNTANQAKLIHIGYPKTGTTTLQKHILPKLGSCLGKFHDMENEVKAKAVGLLQGKEYPIEIPSADIWTYEHILGPSDFVKQAEITRRVFPAEKLLLTIRRQDDLIWSRYLHDHTLERATASYPLENALTRDMGTCTFPACKKKCTCGPIKIIPIPFYDFSAAYEAFSQHYDVMMLPMELLVEDPDQYATLLAGFMGVDPPKIGPLPKENPSKINVDKPDLSSILALYKESNRVLPCPVDLSKWGYF